MARKISAVRTLVIVVRRNYRAFAEGLGTEEASKTAAARGRTNNRTPASVRRLRTWQTSWPEIAPIPWKKSHLDCAAAFLWFRHRCRDELCKFPEVLGCACTVELIASSVASGVVTLFEASPREVDTAIFRQAEHARLPTRP